MMSRSLLCLVLVASASTSAAPPEQHKPRLDALGDPLPQGAIVRLGTNRVRQLWGAVAPALSPEGKFVAASNRSYEEAIVGLWDVATGLPRWQRRYDKGVFAPLVFSQDGKFLAVATPSNVLLIDASSGREARRFHVAPETPTRVWIAPDSKTVLSAAKEGVLRWWDIATGKQVKEWDFFDNKKPADLGNGYPAVVPTFLGLSADGRLAAYRVQVWGRRQAGADPTLEEATVRVFELSSRKELWRGELKLDKSPLLRTPESGQVAAAVDIIAALSPSGDSVVYELRTGKIRHSLHADRSRMADIIALAVSGDGKHVAAVRKDAQLHVWDAATGRLELRLADEVNLASAMSGSLPLTLSGNGKRVAFIENNQAVVVRDTATGKLVPDLPGHRGSLETLEWSADGRRLSSSSFGEPYLFWDSRTGKTTASAPPPGSLRPTDEKLVAVSANRYLCADGTDRLFLCELNSGKRLRQLSLEPQGYFERALSPDGNILVRYDPEQDDQTTLQLYDLDRKLQICRIDKIPDPDGLIFSRDGSRIAWWRYDGQVWLADAATGKNLRAFGKKQSWENRYRAALSANGRYLVVAPCLLEGSPEDENVDYQARVWDVDAGREIGRVGDIRSNVQLVGLSPDGRQFAVGLCEDVIVSEVLSGRERLQLRGHRRHISALTFSPDGAYLATGSDDTTALIWDLFGRHDAPQRKLTQVEFARLWQDLADVDAKHAFVAMRTLIGVGDASVSLLRDHLRPAHVAPERLQRLIADLDDNRFKVRDAARKELEQFHDLAAPALRKALQGKPSQELRQQIARMLDRLRELVPPPEQLRELRALEILEQVGTAEAKRLLEELAKGATEARLTQDAKASLRRLAARRP